MKYFIVALVCLTLGLYAGKRRAKGENWSQIICDLMNDLRGTARTIWSQVKDPFLTEHDRKSTDDSCM